MKALRTSLLLFGLPAIFIWLAPATHTALLYERTAILNGEWWRMWTGHWVHFSTSHLLWNLAVLLGAGVWLEHLQSGWLLRLALVVAPVLSLVLLTGEPAMQSYGGLSGLATGAVGLLALAKIKQRGADQAWWWAILLLVLAKTGVDAVRSDSLFVGFDAHAVRPSALAHAAGAVAAVTLYLARSIRPQSESALSPVNSTP
jgi:rhomboid family GlyGly-CTERM serine protease